MVSQYMKDRSYLSCKNDCNRSIRSRYASYEDCVQLQHWKIIMAGLAFLGLCWLGLKSMEFERDILKLWIYNSSSLTNETSYISEHSSNNIDKDSTESVLQVTKGNILSKQLLLEHLQLLEIIIKLKVVYEGRVFTLQHLCRQVHLPRMHYLDYSIRTDIEAMMPCQIVTPLNCFWEGSKLLNSDHRISTTGADNYHSLKIDWRTFNFQTLLNTFKDTWYGDFFVNLLNETGIAGGYITKPCLDITDPLCPNKSKNPQSIEEVMRNGCYQIAENLYNYPQSLLVGKYRHSIQSLVFLRSASDVFQTMRSNELDWSEEKVQRVIESWQMKLREAVTMYNKKRPYLESILYGNVQFQSKRVEQSHFYALTNNSLSLALDEVSDSKTMTTKYMVAVGIVTLFVAAQCLSPDNATQSHCWLAIAGMSLMIVSIVAGLGLSAVLGLKCSILTTQVVPFIMLGLGVDDLVILTNTYSRHIDTSLATNIGGYPVRLVLHNSITVILLSFLAKISIIGTISFLSVPLMRNFCGQILLITIFQTGSIVFLYPCLLYLDSVRQRNQRKDILCCLSKGDSSTESINGESSPPCHISSPIRPHLSTSQIIFSTEFTTSSADHVPDNVKQYVEINPTSNIAQPSNVSLPSYQTSRTVCDETKVGNHRYGCCWRFRYRVSKTFVHIIALLPFHVTIILLTVALVVLGLYSAISVNCGLKLESIFARGSNEYNYVKHELAEFQINNFDVLTKDIDYVNYQDLVLQLHNSVKAVANVQVFGNGKFWLSSLISWLEALQHDLDTDMRQGLILPNGRWLTNSSKAGLLAMTLLVQDNGAINYRKLSTSRLVRMQQVDPTNFYLYLNVWRSVAFDYDSIPCILYPQVLPFNVDNFIPNNLRVEPSVIQLTGKNLFDNNPLQFVACKYFHKGVNGQDELSLVKTIRTITGRYSERGVSAIPLGNVFSLSEQYISLRYQIMIAAFVSTACVFLVAFLTLNHVMVSIIICLLLSSNMLSPFYFMHFYHLPLNAASGVMALLSGGLGLRLSIYVIVSYCEQSGKEPPDHTTCPDEHHSVNPSSMYVCKQLQVRMHRAISASPCGPALVATLLSCAFISMTSVSYVWEHFFLLPFIGLSHSILNCYFLAPVLCFWMLPAEPILSTGIDTYNKLNTPRTTSTTRSQSIPRAKNSHSNVNVYKMEMGQGHDNLSTIAEESCSLNSSAKSQTSQDNVHKASSSWQPQESPGFIEQQVQSSLSLHYPNITPISLSELALKTSFTYRHSINTNK